MTRCDWSVHCSEGEAPFICGCLGKASHNAEKLRNGRRKWRNKQEKSEKLDIRKMEGIEETAPFTVDCAQFQKSIATTVTLLAPCDLPVFASA